MTSRLMTWLGSWVEAHPAGRTLRVRLTLVYGGLFLLCGVVLLAITYVLFEQVTHPVTKGGGPTLQYPVQQHSDAGLGKGGELTRAGVLHHLLADSAIALAIVTVIALGLGWIVAGRILRPLRSITATARRISASNLHERLSLTGPNDELKELGDTFDDLLARLQRSWDSQRQFIANVSHELRSPVTRLRLQAEIAATDCDATVASLQTGYTAVIATAQHQEDLIAALLSLAKGQRGLDHTEAVDLAPIARDILHAQRHHARQRGLRISTDIAPAIADGDPRLVEQLVRNLVDNAILHNTDGGAIQLTTAASTGYGVITVANDGPNIPTTELDRLFRPFERLEPGRRHHQTGHGLGLSVVEAIATAHGAIITTHARPAGGLSIEVAFPPASNTVPDTAPPVASRGQLTTHAALRHLNIRESRAPSPSMRQ
jgi:signal transduction histidine kinase